MGLRELLESSFQFGNGEEGRDFGVEGLNTGEGGAVLPGEEE